MSSHLTKNAKIRHLTAGAINRGRSLQSRNLTIFEGEMGFFDAFKAKSPQEVMRENKRVLDRSIRELDRERMLVENQIKKTMAEMKKMAKAGQEVGL